MAVNTEIQANNNESSASVIRRFSRRFKSSGVLYKAKSLRYHTRSLSKNVQKNQALRVNKKKEYVDKMIKLGKMKDTRKDRTKKFKDAK